MASGFDDTLRWVHRTNIERYRQILRTPLSGEERSFMRRCIGEEQAAMAALEGAGRPADPAVRIDKVG